MVGYRSCEGRRARRPDDPGHPPVVATVTAVWLGIVAVAALDRAPWGDEQHYLQTVQRFGQDMDFETLRRYPGELAPPLAFALYAWWGRLVGFALPRLRVLSSSSPSSPSWPSMGLPAGCCATTPLPQGPRCSSSCTPTRSGSACSCSPAPASRSGTSTKTGTTACARRRRRASGRCYRTGDEADVCEALARTTVAQPTAAGTVTVTGNGVG
jgi:hypothetical protein